MRLAMLGDFQTLKQACIPETLLGHNVDVSFCVYNGFIYAFELWCWRRLLRVPWTARRSNKSILKERSVLGVHWRDWCWSWTPIFWPPHAKSWLIWKDLHAGKDWGQEKGTTEDEMVRWHHRHNGHGFGWTPGIGDGQGGLACCGSWGRKESDTTEWLNWTGFICYYLVEDFLICVHEGYLSLIQFRLL